MGRESMGRARARAAMSCDATDRETTQMRTCVTGKLQADMLNLALPALSLALVAAGIGGKSGAGAGGSRCSTRRGGRGTGTAVSVMPCHVMVSFVKLEVSRCIPALSSPGKWMNKDDLVLLTVRLGQGQRRMAIQIEHRGRAVQA